MDRLDYRATWRLLAVSIPALAIATAAVAFLQDGLGVPNPSAVYLVAVVATALAAGTVGAVLTSVAAFVLYNYLFTEPRYTLSMHEPGVWLSVVLLLFVGIVVGQLTAVMRSRATTARTREREARALFRLSRALATRSSTDEALGEIATILEAETRVTALWVALDVAQPSNSPSFVNVLRRMPRDEPAVWVKVHNPGGHAPVRGEQDTYRVRIEAAETTLGSIWALRRKQLGHPDATETRLLSAAADQIGQALAQDRYAADSRAVEIARQSDELKSALLQSVSHDLRTPLATIRAAAGTLGSDESDPSTRRESAAAIDREAEYLNRLVGNLLDLSRIEAGALRSERDVFELDDVLAPAMERLKPRLRGRQLEVALDAAPVEGDPVLLDQAFTNVVENVLRHTPADAPVRIAATDVDEHIVRLTVEDGGPGVPPESLSRLFEKFYRVAGQRRTARDGTGIGLAVVSGLLEAMGGRVSARPSALGGLAIEMDLVRAPVPAELLGDRAE